MIIVDTREQKPLWTGKEIVKRKLVVGDYALESTEGYAHAERKSALDLYGSIVQGHKRFRAMILRAKELDIHIAVFVEVPLEKFYSKDFPNGFRCRLSGATLAKIVHTIQEKYGVQFIGCSSRTDMKKKMMQWLYAEEALVALQRIDEVCL